MMKIYDKKVNFSYLPKIVVIIFLNFDWNMQELQNRVVVCMYWLASQSMTSLWVTYDLLFDWICFTIHYKVPEI